MNFWAPRYIRNGKTIGNESTLKLISVRVEIQMRSYPKGTFQFQYEVNLVCVCFHSQYNTEICGFSGLLQQELSVFGRELQ